MNKKWMVALMIGASTLAAWAQIETQSPAKSVQATNQVEFKTTLGDFTIEVYPDNAPKTVQNFLQYVKSGHYNGTIFHRVIGNFMVQGGGFTSDMIHKDTRAPIPLEANNGLRNDRGSVAMARTSDPNSATSQFFINLADNNSLNGTSVIRGTGYAVFGKIIAGMETIDKIRNAPTKNEGKFQDVPVTPIVIFSATSDTSQINAQTTIAPVQTISPSSKTIPQNQQPDICKPFDAFVDNKDGTVTDPRDGLIWKRCAEDFEFNGQSCIMKGNSQYGASWHQAMKAARESRFLGKSDWRLPTYDELRKVVGLNCRDNQPRDRVYAASNMIAHPMEDSNFSRGNFWASTIDEYDRAAVMSFYYGRSDNLEKKDWARHRLVRDTRAEENQQAEKQRLKQAEEKSYFVDDRTGLMWRRCTIGLLWDEQKRRCFGNKEESATWLEVVKLAAEDRLGGFNDWRLPTKTEFNSLINDRPYEYCSELLRRVDSLFPIGSVQGNLWLLDNTNDYQNPTAGRLRIYKDDCRLTNEDFRPFAKFSSILVRGGTVSNEWKSALLKTGSAQEVNNISRQKAAEYWQGVNSKVAGVLSQSGAAVEQKASSNNWILEGTKKVAAVSWSAETYVKCTGSRNRGESFKILHLDNGRYQSVTGPIETTLNKVANFHCN